MSETRKKLIKLLCQKGFGVEGATIAADHLLANGVMMAGEVEEMAPVRRGRWIEKKHEGICGDIYTLFHCSECDAPDARRRNYCRECGAKMDREEEC